MPLLGWYDDMRISEKDAKSDERWPMTVSMTYAGLVLGFTNLTEKNFDEMVIRAEVWVAVGMPHFADPLGDPLTGKVLRETMQDYIGLRTNCSELTRAKFKTMVWNVLLSKAEQSIRIGASNV